MLRFKKSDLEKVIEEQKKKITLLNKQLEEKEIEYRKLEDECLNLSDELEKTKQLKSDCSTADDAFSQPNSWLEFIKEFIPQIAKHCGILNQDKKLVDWIDLKRSVYQSRILSKSKQLEKNGLHNPVEIGEWMCLWIYQQCYNSDSFTSKWRRLEVIEKK